MVRARSSAEEHFLDMEGVTGSIPVAPTIYPFDFLAFLFVPWRRFRGRRSAPQVVAFCAGKTLVTQRPRCGKRAILAVMFAFPGLSRKWRSWHCSPSSSCWRRGPQSDRYFRRRRRRGAGPAAALLAGEGRRLAQLPGPFQSPLGRQVFWRVSQSQAQRLWHLYLEERQQICRRIRQRQDRRSGHLLLQNGNKYVGPFRNEKRNGRGTFTWNDGNVYFGDFVDDKINGQGTFTFFNGNKYVGAFLNEKRNGRGTFTWKDGNVYVGEFVDDKMNGQGVFSFFNGEKYVGEFRNEQRNGKGTFTFPNGDKYVGEFLNEDITASAPSPSAIAAILSASFARARRMGAAPSPG